MTRAERAALLNGEGYGALGQRDGAYVGGTPAIPRLWLPSTHLQDAAQGFRTSTSAIVGRVTSWPCLLALASTWDVDLTRTFAVALGREFKAKGANVALGPSVNIHRVPRNGRNAEYLSGEEPHLGAALTAAYVRGVQSVGLAAVVKHFVLNNQETGRETTSAHASDRALFEVYYQPFIAAIDAGVASLMCSYNRVNRSYACGNAHILVDHLRGALKFRGWVMSDWWALHDDHAAANGVDQDMPGTDGHFEPHRLAALPGSAALEATMTTRILGAMLATGALDESLCTAGCDCKAFLYDANATSDEHVRLAREVGASSAVLLKNDEVLPLAATRTVALVGSACGAPHAINADRASWVDADYYVVGGSGRVISNRAVSIRDALERRGVPLVISPTDSVAKALEAAASANVILACGSGKTYESADRPTLRLDQHELLVGLAQAARDDQREGSPRLPPLVVAIMAPGAVATAPWADGASGIVSIFLAGQETGNAWADVLLGHVNPSGKLPVTFPHRDEDVTPPCEGRELDHCVYDEGLLVGWRALHPDKPVGFPFGFGLSYTTFDYTWMARPTLAADGSASLSVAVRNSGSVAGSEVVQLYVVYPPEANEPPLVLRGFRKTKLLAPGATEAVVFALDVRARSIWRSEAHGGGSWLILSGSFGIVIGSHSRDERLREKLVIP